MEMGRLGLSEEAATAIVAEDRPLPAGSQQQQHGGNTRQVHAPKQAPSQPQHNEGQDEGLLLDPFAEEAGAGAGAAPRGGTSESQGKGQGQAAGSAAAAGSSHVGESVDDWEMAFDLFEGGGEGEGAAGSQAASPEPASTQQQQQGAAAASAAAGPSENGLGATGKQQGGKVTRVIKRAPPLPPKQQQQQKAGTQVKSAVQPRALLFQQCQRSRWAQPRYDKLPGASLQYSVSGL